jgi:hypothetical protein
MGKSGGSEPLMPQDNSAMMMMMMMQMMQQNMAAMQQMAMQQPETPEIPEAPEVVAPEPVDWSEKEDQLREQMKADYEMEQEKRHGLTDTIHTSPLIDEENLEEDEDYNSILTNEG